MKVLRPSEATTRSSVLHLGADVVAFLVGLPVTLFACYRLLTQLWLGTTVEPNVVTALLIGLAALVWPTVQSFKTPFGEMTRRIQDVADRASERVKEVADEATKRVEELTEDHVEPRITGQVLPMMLRRQSVDTNIHEGPQAIATAEAALPKTVHANDPQKERFGGRSEQNQKRVSATVTAEAPRWYGIQVRVESTDERRPLAGPVKFFLHDTFEPASRVVTARNGVARIKLYAYGAFTIGAICADGTCLELDLSNPRLVKQPDEIFKDE